MKKLLIILFIVVSFAALGQTYTPHIKITDSTFDFQFNGVTKLSIDSTGNLYPCSVDPLFIAVTGATYTVLASDHGNILNVTRSSSGICTITIPSALITTANIRFGIKDGGLNAGTYNITVSTEGAETIDLSGDDLVIDGNGNMIWLQSDGTNLLIY